jgi:chaperonin GroEL
MFRPFKAIARNAGCNEEEFFKDVLSGEEDWGYDAVRGERGYLCQMGVVDPLQVVLTALRSAASVASLVLLTESAIVMPVGQ